MSITFYFLSVSFPFYPTQPATNWPAENNFQPNINNISPQPVSNLNLNEIPQPNNNMLLSFSSK